MRFSGILALTCLLAACGGGGSSETSTATPPSPIPPAGQSDLPDAEPLLRDNNLALYLPANARSGESISLAVTPLNGQQISNVQWTQTAGTQVQALSDDAQIIGFELPSSGTYSFNVNVEFVSGISQQSSMSIPVSDSDEVLVNVRRDHVAPETGKVSLRVDARKSISSIQWSQISGERIADFEQQDKVIFFDAPRVNQDELIELNATVRFTDGSESSDTAQVLIKNVNINTQGYFPSAYGQVVTTDAKPYRPESPYANTLVECVYNNQVDSSCRFEQLPLLGQVTRNPSIDDVLDRLVVSHKWMGDNFKRFLEDSATQPDMLKMLRATTAIVISYDVRPSFYWSATGAIYLDAANFWLTPEQRDTLNDQPDFRSNFGNALQFRMPWRYVRNNQYYYPLSGFPAELRNNKSFSDMEASIAWLMYHELAHANDFFPPASWANIATTASPLSYVNGSDPVSDSMVARYPLNSENMKQLAQVRFAGESASATQEAYQPSDVTAFFAPDNATMFYSYFTSREDYALLVERFLMYYRLGVSSDVGVIGSNDTLINWGQRDRIGERQLISRTIYAVQQVFPDMTTDEIRDALPTSEQLNAGEDWFDAVVINAQSNKSAARSASDIPRDINKELHPLHIDRRRLDFRNR